MSAFVSASPASPLPARLLAFAAWSLLAASATYWGIQLLARPQPAPAHAQPAVDAAGGAADLGRLLGRSAEPVNEAAQAPALESRFRLLGLVAPKPGLAGHAGEGVALIAVDGAPPRTVRLGALVDGELRLLAVDGRTATIGREGGASLTLRMEAPAAAATGVPSSASLVAPNAAVPQPNAGAQPVTPVLRANQTAAPLPPPAVLPDISVTPPTQPRRAQENTPVSR